MTTKKRPAFMFYTGDWLKDPELRAVSRQARGLWIDLLCYMWESSQTGYLVNKLNKPYNLEQLARMTGCSLEEFTELFNELLENGVLSVHNEIVCSRRLIKDERIRMQKVSAGKRSAEIRSNEFSVPTQLPTQIQNNVNAKPTEQPTQGQHKKGSSFTYSDSITKEDCSSSDNENNKFDLPYRTGKDLLINENETFLETMRFKYEKFSDVPFDVIIEKFSLSCDEAGKEYFKDHTQRKIRGGFEKYLKSWIDNVKKSRGTPEKPVVIDNKNGHDIYQHPSGMKYKIIEGKKEWILK